MTSKTIVKNHLKLKEDQNSEQGEYELSYKGKIRKEDLFANEDGVNPQPFQIEKEYFDQDIANNGGGG